MVDNVKIDSSSTGLAFAKEATFGVLSSPTWRALYPNSYKDFGGEFVKQTSTPINDSRQNEKGVVTDLNSAGGFNQNFTFFNQLDLFEGLMFAATRATGYELVTAVDIDAANPDEYEVASTTGFIVGNLIKGFKFTNSANNALNVVTAISSNLSIEVATGLLVAEATAGAYVKVVGHQAAAGDLDITTTGDYATMTSTSLNFTTLPIIPGQYIYIGGDAVGTSFTNAANNGFKRVRSVSANAIVFDKSNVAMVTETSASETIQIFFGDVLKNEAASSIVRSTYTIERLLGAPVVGDSNKQSEVISGAVLDEWVLNIPTADLVKTDFSFLAANYQERKATSLGGPGPLQSSVVYPIASDTFNTSTDFRRIKMAVHSTTSETPTPLIAYFQEVTLTFKNNIKPNKAVGTLGSFDMTAGNFSVSANLKGYFATVDAISAIRANSDVTLDIQIVKQNTGIVIDLPLVSLGDGRLDVQMDEPITIPLSMDAARGYKINANLDYTAMFNFFHYLPTAAG